jgi:vancomycin permeability regulator SanA
MPPRRQHQTVSHHFMKTRKTIKYIVTILTIWFVIHISFIVSDGLNKNYKKSDLAVILGSKVNTDGTLSKRLEKRLECGLELFRQRLVKKIIVSGGLGYEGYYEGDKMKEYLIKNGVPDSIIIVDNKGNNTIATVENTLKLKDSLKFESVIVVSQYFHITRAKMLFKRRNFKNVSGASPRYFERRDIPSTIREFVAFYAQL